jgi:hypothetical protein
MFFQASTIAALVPLVAAHGFINDPPARQPGDAYSSICGQQAFSQQSSDINGNVQGIMQVLGTDTTDDCKLWLCKGFQFEDNQDNVQTFSAGQTIAFDVEIAAPHTGYANVSVVDTATDTIIGSPLIEWDDYASNAGFPENNTAFSVTLPDDLSACTEAGACVIQWFWDAPDINQTYESCVDFVVGGAGNGGGDGESPTEPEPTVVPTPPANDDDEGEDDCEEIPEEELPEGGDEEEEVPADDEDDCEEIPDEDLPEEDEDDCEEIPDDAELPDEDEEEELPVGGGDDDVELPPGAPAPIFSTISTELAAVTKVPQATVITETVTVTAEPITVTAQPTACGS